MAEVQSFLLDDDTANIQKFVVDKSGIRVDDPVNHPSHYETGKYECIDVMLEIFGVDVVRSFCIGNVFKYVYRHRSKNGIEDLQKAKWYLDKYLSLAGADNEYTE